MNHCSPVGERQPRCNSLECIPGCSCSLSNDTKSHGRANDKSMATALAEPTGLITGRRNKNRGGRVQRYTPAALADHPRFLRPAGVPDCE